MELPDFHLPNLHLGLFFTHQTLLKMKQFLLSLFSLMITLALQAQHTVSGKVTDENGQPLIGATILEKGTNKGTATGFDGSYKFVVSSPNATLVFSYTGFNTQEIALNGRTELNVTMQEGIDLGAVQIVGTRSLNRTATQTPVAVDIINVGEVTRDVGQLDVNQMLQYVAPSFNASRQSGADGADHIDPATLRGLGPDQTLVLVNGKRRHQSSLINIFGSRGRGNTGTDLNAIPAPTPSPV
jgi:iron complex outermembrane recepter protein